MTENKTTELKREYIDTIKNTVTAFAKCYGGTIYIGINDDGSVCGVEDVDTTMLRASGAIRDAIRPDVSTDADPAPHRHWRQLHQSCASSVRSVRPYYKAGGI